MHSFFQLFSFFAFLLLIPHLQAADSDNPPPKNSSVESISSGPSTPQSLQYAAVKTEAKQESVTRHDSQKLFDEDDWDDEEDESDYTHDEADDDDYDDDDDSAYNDDGDDDCEDDGDDGDDGE